jgi:hypothetical protein
MAAAREAEIIRRRQLDAERIVKESKEKMEAEARLKVAAETERVCLCRVVF